MQETNAREYTHKLVINPNPKIAVPMIGIMKWALAWADQPYQLTYVRLGARINAPISQ
jgi:hypothetical protein